MDIDVGAAPVEAPAVKKKIEVVPAPILGPTVKGTAPSRETRAPFDEELRDLLPPLDPAARARVVDALADIGLAELDGGSTADVTKD